MFGQMKNSKRNEPCPCHGNCPCHLPIEKEFAFLILAFPLFLLFFMPGIFILASILSPTQKRHIEVNGHDVAICPKQL